MVDRSPESVEQVAQAVVEVVQGSLTQEERAFGTLPNGELLGRYALETFMDLVSVSALSSDENRGG
jgi:hypothetical protein